MILTISLMAFMLAILSQQYWSKNFGPSKKTYEEWAKYPAPKGHYESLGITEEEAFEQEQAILNRKKNPILKITKKDLELLVKDLVDKELEKRKGTE